MSNQKTDTAARPGLQVWSDVGLAPAAHARLLAGLAAGGHRFLPAAARSTSVLTAGQPDPALALADVAFGQPDAAACRRHPRLRWVALSTAGYTRYDDEATRAAFAARRAVLTNASSVFAEPCAQHALALMLSLNRALPACLADQLGPRTWAFHSRRAESRLLGGQTVLLLGFGAIARRLVELLAPFGMKIYALRRRRYSERGVHIIPEEQLSAVLPVCDHLVNLLPENEDTRRYVNARRLAALKPGAFFYNLGRGATVDEPALLEALHSGRLGAAYLDVTATEPLPPSDPLWSAPRCWITPHSAGGRHDQDEALVEAFLANLALYAADRRADLRDLVWSEGRDF
jgi:phosphoglycerate dehydrogenase-like enzyme